jgi:hypothetical protein
MLGIIDGCMDDCIEAQWELYIEYNITLDYYTLNRYKRIMLRP